MNTDNLEMIRVQIREAMRCLSEAVKHLGIVLHTFERIAEGEAQGDPLSRQVELWCDGGTKETNPGIGYGSYLFGDDGLRTFDFERRMSNNSAEYLALIAGLRAVAEAYAPATVHLTVKTDSQLVEGHVQGIPPGKLWKVKAEHLRPLRDEARALLKGFTSWRIEHVPRKTVVKILSH